MGVVLDRDAYEKARRVDAALRGKADQAPGPLPAGRGGDYEHRVVELGDELVNLALAHGGWTLARHG